MQTTSNHVHFFDIPTGNLFLESGLIIPICRPNRVTDLEDPFLESIEQNLRDTGLIEIEDILISA